jgi:adenosylhomocysteine nucleosidase
MIYILVALKGELPEHNLDESKFKVWYTGVGKVNATMFATMAAIQKDCAGIVNYGTAGVLKEDMAEQLHIVGVCRQRDMDARPQAHLGTTPFEETPYKGDIVISSNSNVTLSTGDNFVTTKPELGSDLVDMEGYAIAKVSRHMNKPCLMLKYGSDFADENAADTWEQNQANGAALFLDYMNNLFSETKT